ncbi:MAG: calcium-binding protein [Thermodesulfobacteriota bacterium]
MLGNAAKTSNAYILQQAQRWYGSGYEYGMTPGGNGNFDRNPGNGYWEIDCGWLITRALQRAGYKWITEPFAVGRTQWYDVIKNPGPGDLILFAFDDWESAKTPAELKNVELSKHGVIIQQVTALLSGGGFKGTYYDSHERDDTWWETIYGREVFGPGPGPGGVFVDYSLPVNAAGTFDLLKKIEGDYLPGLLLYYLRPKELVQPAPKVLRLPGERASGMRRDPLVLDLIGNGPVTVGVDAGIHFDQDANGFAEASGWIGPGAGVLMLDRNGNARLDDARELFGDFTLLPNGMRATNGFEALAQYDVNKDGKIDPDDPIWSQLRVWHYNRTGLGSVNAADVNSLGTVDSMSQLGISALYLDAMAVNTTDDSQNIEIRTGHFERWDGGSGAFSEFRFDVNTSKARAAECLEVPTEIEALPDLMGSGNLHDLHQAIVRDSSGQLKGLTEAFVHEKVTANRADILEQLLFKWSGADTVDPASRAPFIDPRRLVFLQELYARQWPNPDIGLATFLNQTYQQNFEIFYSSLMGQTHLKGFFESIEYSLDEQTITRKGDLSAAVLDLTSRLQRDPAQGQEDLSEFARALRGLDVQDRVNYLSFRETFIQQDPSLAWVIDTGGLPVFDHVGQGLRPWSHHIEGTDNADAVRGSLTEGDGVINSFSGEDVLYGTSRDEVFYQESGDALLVGGGGNDKIWAGADDDILDGGTGNDRLYGEAGNDTYIFRRGSGHDQIVDIDTTVGNTDTIWLGSSLTPEDISLKAVGTDLVLKIIDTGDTLAATSFFDETRPMFRIERIQFMDGTVWNETDIHWAIYRPSEVADYLKGTAGDDEISTLGGNDTVLALAGDDTVHGGADADTIYGGAGNDALFGDEGSDTVYSETGDDTLAGGQGDDRLVGGAGRDVLDGGPDNDLLQGEADRDTYLFGRGSGNDTIIEALTTDGSSNTVALGEGILPTDVVLQRSSEYTLTLLVSGTDDGLWISDWAASDSSRKARGEVFLLDFLLPAERSCFPASKVQDLTPRYAVEARRAVCNENSKGGRDDEVVVGLRRSVGVGAAPGSRDHG